MSNRYAEYRAEGDRYFELGYLSHALTAYTLATAMVKENSAEYGELQKLIAQCQVHQPVPSSGVS